MKMILLVLTLMLSFNVFPANYSNQYKNAPSTDTYIVFQAHARMRVLKSEIFKIEKMAKFNKASSYHLALLKKMTEEYNYLYSKYGNPARWRQYKNSFLKNN